MITSVQSSDIALQQAIAHHRAGRLAEAERLYRVVLQTIPNQSDANHNLGILVTQRGRADLGLPHLKAALEANPAQSQYWLSYAEALLVLGQPQGALAILERGKQRGLSGPAVDGLMARMGISGPRAGGPDVNGSILYATALQHHQAGEIEEAIKLYRRILADKPDFAEAHAYLGNALKAQGALEEAVASYQRALFLQPGFIEVHVNIGNVLTIQGKLDEAIASYRKALAARPDFAEAHYNLGNALKAQGALEEAVASYRQAIILKPVFAAAHYSLGNARKAQGAFEEALVAYRQALAAQPDFAEAHNNLGNILSEQGKSDEAIACYRRALAIRPDYTEAHNNLGSALKAQGALDEAAASYRQALFLKPDYAEAHNDLGIVLFDQGKLDEAAVSHRRALAVRPDYADAHYNLGNVLTYQGKLNEAVESYNHALDLMPDFVMACHNLGLVLCECDRVEEGLAAFTRHAKLVYGTPSSSPLSNEPIPPHKARHDREQHEYLTDGKTHDDNPGIKTIFRLEDGDRLATPAVNPDNAVDDIAERWRASKPQIVVIDNLLTNDALDRLRRFCWGSTVWRKVYDGGYLGAFPEHGFSCPLLAQIADELRDTFPVIFRSHPLHYLWAFKYDNELNGIKVHADKAAVNVNFWITPDEANLDPKSGGLVIWDVAAPLDWEPTKYNSDVAGIRAFLAHENAKSVTIPYRANRAVIFDSDLFHETDRMVFKDGYCNRRINITLLYGHRGE